MLSSDERARQTAPIASPPKSNHIWRLSRSFQRLRRYRSNSKVAATEDDESIAKHQFDSRSSSSWRPISQSAETGWSHAPNSTTTTTSLENTISAGGNHVRTGSGRASGLVRRVSRRASGIDFGFAELRTGPPIKPDMKKGLKKILGKDSSSGSSTSSNGKGSQGLPSGATVTNLDDNSFQVETAKTRIHISKHSPDDISRHLPFSVLNTLLTNFTNQMSDESKTYGADYGLYRDPTSNYQVLTISVERVKQPGPRQDYKLTYSDLILLGSGAKEYLWKIEDETCEFRVYRRDKYADNGEALVGKGNIGFNQTAALLNGE